MTNETKYGVISDVHMNPAIVPLAIEVLKKQGAEKLLINGDIGNHQRTLEESQGFVGFILDAVGKSGLESFVQPGSHETVGAYAPVIDYFTSKYPNIVDVLKAPKAEQKGHDLVFLPGSDFLCGGEYSLNSQEDLPTGGYIKTAKGLVPATYEQYFALASGQIGGLDKSLFPIRGFFQNQNMHDLRKLVTAPEKTVVICHVPRKFDGVDTCVDMAYFAEDPNGAVIPGVVFENQIKQQFGNVSPEHMKKIASENGYSLRTENRGNADLAKLYQELGITKAVSGHFHDSSHRANDSYNNHVPEGKLVTDLFWNSGHLDSGHTGILKVDGEKVGYQNIQLQDYLK